MSHNRDPEQPQTGQPNALPKGSDQPVSLSMSKKLILTAVGVALILLVSSLLSTHVFASSRSSNEPKVLRLEMGMESMTLRVNQQRFLWASIGVRTTIPINYDPELKTYTGTKEVLIWHNSSSRDYPVSWSSSNEEIARVDPDGLVTGISPGTAIITAAHEDGLSVTCTVTVSSTALTGIELQTGNQELAGETNSGERLDATQVRADVETAVKAAPPGETAVVTYSQRTIISTTALRAADYTARTEGGQAKLRFRTLDGEGAIQGQLTVWPENAPADDYDLRLEVSVLSQSARNAAAMGKSYFGASQATGVVLAHQGGFGMSVEVAARSDLPSGQAIRLYRYESGSYTLVESAGCWMDSSGYLHFTVSSGGTYVALC